MKLDKSNILGIVISVLLSTVLNVMAQNIIPSNSVSYTNSKTSETTVEGSLNELFSAVDINGRLGVKDITNIGSTITDAVYNLNSNLSGKQASITGGASTITSNNLTASRALISNNSGKVAVSDITSTELSYLDGVTSNLQTQLNNKSASGHNHDDRYYTEEEINKKLYIEPKSNGISGVSTSTFNGSHGITLKWGDDCNLYIFVDEQPVIKIAGWSVIMPNG